MHRKNSLIINDIVSKRIVFQKNILVVLFAFVLSYFLSYHLYLYYISSKNEGMENYNGVRSLLVKLCRCVAF